MHSSNMKVTNADLKYTFDVFLQFLEDKTKLNQLPKTKEAAQEIKEVSIIMNIQKYILGLRVSMKLKRGWRAWACKSEVPFSLLQNQLKKLKLAAYYGSQNET